VATVGGRDVFVPIDQVSSFDGEALRLSSAKLDLRHFERLPGSLGPAADRQGHPARGPAEPARVS
jgi:hypothetical protein